ncbi:MAG: hypothetical protein JW956_07370, partial [Calditrichaceae bacterium]|nr:hypothetical protein [Calditrichaceae bacterium]
SQSWVKCIFQDSHGFLWFGTAEGINKYDGTTFQIYKHDPGNKYSLSNNLVNVIFEDSRGILWVGTQSGINFYNRDKDQFERYPALHSEYINDFVELNDGRIVIAHNSGLYLMDNTEALSGNRNQLDRLISIFPQRSANDILLDKEDNLWIATFDGLYFIEKNATAIINIKPDIKNSRSYSGNAIHTVYQDLTGRIWLGTFESGLLLLKLDPAKRVN